MFGALQGQIGRVLGRKWRKPAAEITENAEFAALRLTKGARRPQVRELALGALPLAPGAPDRTTFALFCVRVLGGSRVGVRSDRFGVFLYCFHLLFYWNILDFIKNLYFLNGSELGSMVISVIGNYGKRHITSNDLESKSWQS
jgi:hypothetical protein